MMYSPIWSMIVALQLVIVSVLALSAICGIILCLTNRNISAGHKVAWAIAFIGSGIIGLLVYLAVFSKGSRSECPER
ncbi:MAG: hypothetical protein K2I38_06105 [Duncaniella sp.]|nr:hypothetical protein [Duncaniella sp.]